MHNKTQITKWSYRTRFRVMSMSEQALYIALLEALSDKFIVLSKVRIEDFICVNPKILSENEIIGLRDYIKSRHVDFLICKFKPTRPLLAIELDGESHDTPKQVERDQRVNIVYREAGLTVKHIRVGVDFTAAARKIRARLLR